MAHFGLLAYKGAGHLNPLLALSRRLVSRGHRVTVFQQPDMEQKVRQHGLEYFAMDAAVTADASSTHIGKSNNHPISPLAEIRSRLQRVNEEMRHFLEAYPAAIRASGVDTLLIGEISLAGPSVAEMMRLPYFIVSTTIPHNFGWKAPRFIEPRTYWWEHLRKELLEVSVLRMRGPVRRSLDKYRKQLELQSICNIGKTFPELAHITQWPQCLDIPRHKLPPRFFYAGPFIDVESRPIVNFPWERLDDRPLVYVSLGTTRKGNPELFYKIAEACEQLNLQAAITFGGTRDSTELPQFPGNAIVVSNAPQLELLQHANLVVTHAGPNTVLETLRNGKPMLALPITLDQPAIAANLSRLGVAEVLSAKSRSAGHIRDALAKLLSEPRYRHTAENLQQQLCTHDGLDNAAQIIEDLLPK